MGISPLLEGYFPEGSFVWLTFCHSVRISDGKKNLTRLLNVLNLSSVLEALSKSGTRKRLRSPRIDSKEPIPSAYVAWRAVR
jgi:hypothetical protein